MFTNETATVETPEQQAEEIAREKDAPKEDKPDLDKENDHGRKPPETGKCKRCGLERPLNRLKLCYRCWVIEEIKDVEKQNGRAWNEGDPHPAWCHCEGLGEHKNGDGTSRGLN
jgi:hypothetical protein